MSKNEKLLMRLNYWDFVNYFPNNKWYIFIHKNNENKVLIDICKNKKFKDYEIYIKDEYNATKYFKISLNGKFYIQNYDLGIKEEEIEKECKKCWTDFWNPSDFQEYYKYIDICDVFYFDVVGFDTFS